MQGKFNLIVVLTDDVPGMLRFYRDALGFKVADDLGDYVTLKHGAVQLALAARSVLADVTGHADFRQTRQGQAFGLAFPVTTQEAVDQSYQELIAKGAQPIKSPSLMAWGQYTGFFADPEGNVHEIFTDL